MASIQDTKTTPPSSQRLGVHSTQGNLLCTLFMIMKLLFVTEGGENELLNPHP